MISIRTTDLYRIFDKLDKNGDGLVSLEELMLLLESIGVQTTPAELRPLVGKDHLDRIDFVFFHDLIINKEIKDNHINTIGEISSSDDHCGMMTKERDLRQAFAIFDSNGDGFITGNELKSALCRLGLWDDRQHCGKDYCATVISVYDTNHDGKLDFEEFKNMML